jgi:hypothetical protein
VLYEVDTDHIGPGALRNRMLANVTTPFVVFLDADDFLAPTFIEETLREYRRTKKYIYTDWFEGSTYTPAPKHAWCGGTAHIVTALVPTAWAREVGGFDEDLPAMEDTDFFMKLVTRRHCGARLPIPLVTYTDDGLRSDELHADKDMHKHVQQMINKRYEGMYGCCGDEQDLPPVGERMEGDVLCQALWNGKHTEASAAIEHRIYPRIAFPSTTWVNERDARANAHLWRIIELPVDEAQPMEALDGLELAMRLARVEQPKVVEYVAPHADPVATKPDVSKVRQLGAKRKQK